MHSIYNFSLCWFDNTLKNNTIRCKELTTIVSGRKNVARPFFRQKQVSTSGTLLLHFGTRAYLFRCEEGPCYVFSTRNNCCEFLASDGVIFQSVIKPFFKMPVFGAPLTSMVLLFKALFNCTCKRQFVVLHCHKKQLYYFIVYLYI